MNWFLMLFVILDEKTFKFSINQQLFDMTSSKPVLTIVSSKLNFNRSEIKSVIVISTKNINKEENIQIHLLPQRHLAHNNLIELSILLKANYIVL